MYFQLCFFCRRSCLTHFTPILTIKRYVSKNYYDVLKVPLASSSKEIREAFISLSKQNHPDKHLNDPSMHEKFVQINEAYSTLINPLSRRAYDLTLHHKRKLNAPYDRPYTASYKTSTTTDHNSQKSTSKDYSYGSTSHDQFSNPFYWHEKTKEAKNHSNTIPVGVFSFRKFTNTVIVSFLLAFTVVGVLVQILTIRSTFSVNQRKELEKSREYGLIHMLAKENAKLYGNAHQIEVLKKNLTMSYDIENDDSPNNEPLESKNREPSTDGKEIIGKVPESVVHQNKGKADCEEMCAKVIPTIHTEACAKQKLQPSGHSLQKSAEPKKGQPPSEVCKKCNKCRQKVK